jgi:hypothetical protein
LEGPRFARSMEDIAPRFLRTKFDHIFRGSKLLTGRVSFHEDRPGSPLKSPATSSYAMTVARSGSAPNGVPGASAVNLAVSAPPSMARGEAPASSKIFRNRFGQRVDLPLPFDMNILGPLKARKLCNKHFLTGSCPYNPCTHTHSAKLNANELQTLRYIARLTPCYSIYCEDENCISSHRCPSDPSCDRGRNCRWHPEMHNVDTQIVNQIRAA